MSERSPKKVRLSRAARVVYAITNQSGAVMLPTMRSTKRICIKDYTKTKAAHRMTWAQLKRVGCSCVPCQLRLYEVAP